MQGCCIDHVEQDTSHTGTTAPLLHFQMCDPTQTSLDPLALEEALMKDVSPGAPLLQWLAEAHYSSSCGSSALTSIISASLAHTLAFQLFMQATHTAIWEACQEQFLIKLSLCQSFPRT